MKRVVASFLLGFASVCAAQTATQNRPSAFSDALAAGSQALQHGDLPQAVASFRNAVALEPSSAGAHFNLGLALEQQGAHPDAVKELEAARKLQPALRGVNLFLGIAEFRLNLTAKAEDDLKRAVKADPKDAKAWMWLGVVETASGKSDEAVAALDKAAELDPNDPDILYHRGRAHLLVSKSSYERMFALDRNSYRVHQVLAEADAESQQIPEAIAEYKAAIALAPHHPGLNEELGDLYWANDKTAEADAAYTAELANDPYSAMAEYKLGCLRELTGNAASAAELLLKAIALDPAIENAYYYLGRAQIELGDDPGGIANLERAARAKGDPSLNALALYQLSRVYRRLHRNPEADAALALFRVRRADSERAEAEGRAARIARHELPKQESLPADAKPDAKPDPASQP